MRGARRRPELADRALLADHHARAGCGRDLGERVASAARRDDVRADVAERGQPSVPGHGAEPTEAATGDVLEEHALDRVVRAELEDLVEGRGRSARLPGCFANSRLRAMPIHLRAEPGDYAEACLLPGDPLRAKYIAETFLDEPRSGTGSAGCSATRAHYEGKPVSVQSTGMGCPSAAIVIEELVQLGVKRFLRVGTCGGLQPDLELGDLIVALTAVPADGTAQHYVGTSRTARPPTGSSSTAPSTRRRSSASRCASGRSSRATSSTTRTTAARALVGARRARGRDGGGGALHARRAAQGPGRAAC